MNDRELAIENAVE